MVGNYRQYKQIVSNTITVDLNYLIKAAFLNVCLMPNSQLNDSSRTYSIKFTLI